MLEIAENKAKKQKIDNLRFVHGYAEKLPFKDNSIDTITISFGFRNFNNYEKALKEINRVLKPEGKLAILEFSKPTSKWFSPIFKFYFNKIVPKIGALLSRKDAYLYLPESVDYFLTRDDVCEKMNKAGFKNIVSKDYTFGIATLYIGEKVE